MNIIKIVPRPEAAPDSVTARQFHMQLAIAGFTTAVEDWIGRQQLPVQKAFEYSGNFVRTETMMQAGFAALGFSDDEIDAFYLAASKL